jgi:hypothetical protein
VCLEALLKVGSNAYIALGGKGKALEKIDIFHDCPPSPRLRGTHPSLPKGPSLTYRDGEKVACHPKLWRDSRAKGGGADRDRTDDLLNAIQALSQLSYGPTIMMQSVMSTCKGKRDTLKSQS